MMIPFFDLKRQYQVIKDEVQLALNEIFSKCQFILGDTVNEFEKEFANYCNVKHCIGVSSGTAALFLALKACNIGPGDEVITVSHTFVATAEVISLIGAIPVFVDISPDTYLMDIEKINNVITEKTKAIIPVHLYGQCVDIDSIIELVKGREIWIIEDAAQAHGALYKGRRAGSMGHLGCFSFYPSKNLGAYGDGGAIVTNDDEIAKKLRMLRDHGQIKKYFHEIIGFNSRLDAIQAAILKIKLKYLDKWNKMRREIAFHYDKILKEYVRVPYSRPENTHIYHLYVIMCEYRDKLQKYLLNKDIYTQIHYPIPIHLQMAFKGKFKIIEPLNNTEYVTKHILSLPMYPELEVNEIEYVSENILKFFKG